MRTWMEEYVILTKLVSFPCSWIHINMYLSIYSIWHYSHRVLMIDYKSEIPRKLLKQNAILTKLVSFPYSWIHINMYLSIYSIWYYSHSALIIDYKLETPRKLLKQNAILTKLISFPYSWIHINMYLSIYSIWYYSHSVLIIDYKLEIPRKLLKQKLSQTYRRVEVSENGFISLTETSKKGENIWNSDIQNNILYVKLWRVMRTVKKKKYRQIIN
jgi:hypothetical protein